ncbi:MAG: FkbM family methyltransferase [Sphingobacteriales bacterium]|nr:FkbM family methyltransferase [Sphingobacteriales bacterium]MBI3718026.1 FkbM family methyltransferase [Sphingobacteriales bacterium]
MNLIKKILPEKFKRKIKEDLGVPSLHWTLENIKRIGFKPAFVIDGGAYEGKWALDFLEVFPGAEILMLEAQNSKEVILQSICRQYKKLHYHIGLLSGEDGKMLSFFENETASHVTESPGDNSLNIKSESLDAIVKRGNYPMPDFIKLDLQGFELEVLKGADNCLANAAFCLLEVTLIDLGGTPLILETLDFMATKGFQAYDICQFIRRPYDRALWQMDLLFIKSSSPYISEKRWN